LALDDHVPWSIESKTLRDCSNGADVTPMLVPEGMVEPVDDEQQQAKQDRDRAQKQ
jgi:hypothetical protein